jgi:hypothetical protein
MGMDMKVRTAEEVDDGLDLEPLALDEALPTRPGMFISDSDQDDGILTPSKSQSQITTPLPIWKELK